MTGLLLTRNILVNLTLLMILVASTQERQGTRLRSYRTKRYVNKTVTELV